MNKTNKLTQNLVWLLLPLLAFAGLNVRADHHEAPPPPAALEAYFCNYNSGKDRDDLDAATSFYMKQAEKAGIAPTDAFLWTHMKGGAPADFVWLTVHESLIAYGAAQDADSASSEMAAVQARYDTVATCIPNLGMATPVIAPDPEGNGPDGATIATYACNFRPGASAADLPDLTNHIAGVNAEMGDAALDAAFQIVPLTSGPEGPEVVLVAAADSTEKWATNIATLNTTPAGQSMIRHFNAVVNCGMNLWSSDQVVGGDG